MQLPQDGEIVGGIVLRMAHERAAGSAEVAHFFCEGGAVPQGVYIRRIKTVHLSVAIQSLLIVPMFPVCCKHSV